jgi:hypothetical protein
MSEGSRTDDAGSGQSPALGYTVTVLAEDSAAVVTAAGGLIFDRARAGWKVQTYLVSPGDERPLRIVGVSQTGHAGLGASGEQLEHLPDALVVSASLYTANSIARRYVAAACRSQRVEVAMWGNEWPTSLVPGIGPVEHQLSSAAREFKRHAMVAAGVPPETTPTESFHSGKWLLEARMALPATTAPGRM